MSKFDQQLEKYAELIVKIGLNLKPGQRLLMVDASRNHGIPISFFPLVRMIAEKAYQAGADYVDVIWSDDKLKLIRFQNAPRDTFDIFPDWLPNALLEYVQRGDALLNITGIDPDLLGNVDPNLLAVAQKTILTKLKPALEYTRRNAVNWTLVSAPVPGWAAKVFPDLPESEQVLRLWDMIFRLVRLDNPDPVESWRVHLADLSTRCDYLNHKCYRAFHYRAPDTDLVVGLPRLQLWRGGQITAENGISFVPNLPTEEVFTLADKDSAEGFVRSSKTLLYSGQIVEDFTLQFSQGKVVNFSAKRGETVLRRLFEIDEGASRLGEVALVSQNSPIAQSGLLFHNTLLDENAASHLAFGAAYKFSLQGGERMTNEAFASAGGNSSIAHVDFMIGSSEMDIDGICEDGETEPVMRNGEWAF
jgi:aminopeptidase